MILTSAQNEIAADLHRFRVLNCGRRFGKTSLAIEEMKGKALGKECRIAYIAPTIQQARDIAWEQIKRELRSVAISIKEAPSLEIKIRTVKGGESVIILRGWEAVDTLRGQAFDFLVIDEVASMRNFWINWSEVLRPTLTDREGEALFISTPKGFNHFYDLYNLRETNPAYSSHHFTSYDNPYIKASEIDAAKGDSNFEQEYLANFRKAEGLVYKEFDRARHVYKDLPDDLVITDKIIGIDWGFVHPAAVLEIHRDRADDFWVTSEFVERGKTDKEVAEYAAALHGNAYYPDPESANANEELKRTGANVRAVVKGKDSEKNGIDKVRELFKANKLHIHISCVNTIGELETHAYKDGKDEPEDTGEDALDALRYPIMMIMPQTDTDEPVLDEDKPTYSAIGV